ncbi:hypothetical protein MTR_4g051555 [Medicago truncatula]|uniref:Uncharacterized protein n=1 Tax=Medicago truncatula TaxID=3880 RepID=A0A072UKZ7_MEDTR|nr:hypothetical protein MTR_4g051555 [Medicago truncatula]
MPNIPLRTLSNAARDVIVNVPGVDLGENKEEDFWKTVYYPLLKDDSDVDYMFRQNVLIYVGMKTYPTLTRLGASSSTTNQKFQTRNLTI